MVGLPPPNKLAFPMGRAPGFNFSHPAVRKWQGIGMSLVATGQPACSNILNPNNTPSTATSVTAANTPFGPTIKTSGASVLSYASPFGTSTPTSFVNAAIFALSSTSQNFSWFLGTGAEPSNINGLQFGNGNATLVGVASNGVSVTAPFACVNHTPYFALTFISARDCFIFLTNLLTGQIGFATSTTGGSPAALTTPWDCCGFGGSRGFAGNLATATMLINAIISFDDCLQWAGDPWSFWYPPARPTRLFVGAIPFVPRKTPIDVSTIGQPDPVPYTFMGGLQPLAPRALPIFVTNNPPTPGMPLSQMRALVIGMNVRQAWEPPDPPPTLEVKYAGRPGWSVDAPPVRRKADDPVPVTWIPPDPQPTLEVKLAGRPGWSVDNPPVRRKADDPIPTTWIPPDPLPTLTVTYAGRPGWSVDLPPGGVDVAAVNLAITVWATFPPDPLPTLPVERAGRPGWSVDPPPGGRAPTPRWPDPDTSYQQPRSGAPIPPPVVVAYVPIAQLWLGAVLGAWVPPDPSPTTPRNLPAALTNNPPSPYNPIGPLGQIAGNLAAWQPPDAVPRFLPYAAIPVSPQAPPGFPWVSAVLAAWTPVDPLPAPSRGRFVPGMSVDTPIPGTAPTFGQEALSAWAPVDPAATMPTRLAGRPGWSVDQPPNLRPMVVAWPDDPVQPWIAHYLVPAAPAATISSGSSRPWLGTILTAWQPPDPLPTLPWARVTVGIRVDQPPPYSTAQMFATVSVWNIPPDPAPQGFHKVAGLLGTTLKFYRFVTGTRDNAAVAGARGHVTTVGVRDRAAPQGQKDKAIVPGKSGRAKEPGQSD